MAVKFTLHARPNIQIPYQKLRVGDTVQCFDFPLIAVTQSLRKANQRSSAKYTAEHTPSSGPNDYLITRIS